MFDNAKRYNPAGSDCFLMAQTLQVCVWMALALLKSVMPLSSNPCLIGYVAGEV